MASEVQTGGKPLMVAARVAVVVAVVLACLFVCAEGASKQVLARGNRNAVGQRVLFNQTVNATPSYIWKAKKDVCFPKVKNHPRVNITAFSVYDLGKGGFVKLISGGVNFTQVCLHYEAKSADSGFSFLTIIWGR